MVASEATPYAKTGGLADVIGSLPPALLSIGHDVRLVLPWYRSVQPSSVDPQKHRRQLEVPLGNRIYQVSWGTGNLRGVPVYFIHYPEFFDRPELYGEQGKDYPDNAERFALLSRAALELARDIGFSADVVHAHDWQTGLVPVYLHQTLRGDPFFNSTACLFSIHNLGYQGLFPLEAAKIIGLKERLLVPEGLEYFGQISLLKAGIQFADRINTVSPTYCQEIQTPQQGMGMDGVLRSRADRLNGLLNGLDNDLWCPASDKALPRNYSTRNLAGKSVCKKRLQEELGLSLSPDTPLAAMVTRLDSQKGIELILENWDRLMQPEMQLVILGTGNPDFEHRLAEAASFYRGQASVILQFNDALSRRIYAGSDLFLMPSRYEPCGLGQLIALRYGSVPLVHATGGLADTVTDPQEGPERANGFVFHEYQHSSFLDCLNRALETFSDARAWRQLMLYGMAQDRSWREAARQYVELYRLCIRRPDDRSAQQQ